MPSTLLLDLARSVRNLWKSETVTLRGSVIPAKHLRFGGANFADDEAFLVSGEREADRLARAFGLTGESRVLEIGCGTGRLPIGILRNVGEIQAYRGIDVSAAAVRWCKRRIERAHPNFRFLHINVKNDRYNPAGGAIDERFRLPFEDQSFDVIYLYSVFSHMVANDVETYLREFARLLAPGGKIFLTAFVEENVHQMTVNPQGYRQEWKGALHCVRYDRMYFEELLRRHGLRLAGFDHAAETDGQSGLTVTRA